jgi:hypothetical protein
MSDSPGYQTGYHVIIQLIQVSIIFSNTDNWNKHNDLSIYLSVNQKKCKNLVIKWHFPIHFHLKSAGYIVTPHLTFWHGFAAPLTPFFSYFGCRILILGANTIKGAKPFGTIIIYSSSHMSNYGNIKICLDMDVEDNVEDVGEDGGLNASLKQRISDHTASHKLLQTRL